MTSVELVLGALERVMRGEIDRDEIVKIMNDIPLEDKYGVLSEALHQSYHYLSDRDLRDNDPEYDRVFRKEISDYSSTIRSLGPS